MKKDKNNIGYLISIIMCIIILLLVENTYSFSNDLMIEEAREAVIETAEAYYRKGVNIQYDDYRRDNYSAPEAATAQNTVYMVCNNFIYHVYYETFGIVLPMGVENDEIVYSSYKPYAQGILRQRNGGTLPQYVNNGDDTIIYYANKNSYITNDLEDDNFLIDTVMPGDIISIYREEVDEEGNKTGKSVNGHVMMVESVDKSNKKIRIINSGGSNYNANSYVDRIETSGTVLKNTDLIQYLKEENDKASSGTNKIRLSGLMVIRIINDGLDFVDFNDINKRVKLSLTNKVKSRLKYPMIDISKVYSVETQNNNQNRIVELNDVIKYTINITNNSDTVYSDLVVDEVLPYYVSFIEGSQTTNDKITFNSNSFKWNISELASSETVTISYKVKVNYNTDNLGKYIISSGKVDNIDNTTITHVIGINLSEKQKNALSTAYYELRNEKISLSELDFIKEMYGRAGLNSLVSKIEKLYDDKGNEKIVNDLISLSADDGCQMIVDGKWQRCRYRYNIVENVSDMVLTNNYGIRINGNEEVSENARQLEYNGKTVIFTDTIYWFRTAWNLYAHIGNAYYDDRARSIRSNELEIGDIVMAYSTYDDDDTIKDHVVIINNTDGTKIARSSSNTGDIYSYTESGTRTFLSNIIGNNYIIFRPSLAYNYYTIKYNSNGGIGNMDDMLVNMDDKVTLRNNTFNRSGYEFVGWNTKKDGTGTSYTNNQEVSGLTSSNNAQIVLYAVWQSTGYLKGDMNRNNKIDLADIIILLKGYLGNDVTPEELSIGDMNDNERIDLADIIILLKDYLNS